MAIFVNTNVGSLHGRNNLNRVNNCLDTSYQRLSSGLRINSARDDAAGLQIADRMTSQINGLAQGNRNASDAIALLQTMEGALDEITNSVQKIRTITVQAANGTNTKEDRIALGQEAYQLCCGMQQIVDNTKFGGKAILAGHKDGSTDIFSDVGVAVTGAREKEASAVITFQLGANGGDTIEFTIDNFNQHFQGGGGGVTNGVDPGSTYEGSLANLYAQLGTSCNGTIASAQGSLDEIKARLDAPTSTGLSEDLDELLHNVDKTLKHISGQRANIGATINRIESTIRSQSNTIANQSDARSRIRDTDFAAESANLSQQNIIQQAATSMLMQANARPQLALSLLG